MEESYELEKTHNLLFAWSFHYHPWVLDDSINVTLYLSAIIFLKLLFHYQKQPFLYLTNDMLGYLVLFVVYPPEIVDDLRSILNCGYQYSLLSLT